MPDDPRSHISLIVGRPNAATRGPRMGDAPGVDIDGMELRRRTAGFLVPNVVCLIVWLATGAGSFWPGWVLLGTGIAFVVWLIRAGLGVADEHDERRRLPGERPRRVP